MAGSTALYRNKPKLRARLREIPACAGIYRFYDVDGAVIYVGKSVCLRDRVRSYFTGKADCKKVRRLRQEVAALEWEETGSELEALLLESRTVKRLQPRFNVMLRGFVPLPYVRVDLTDPFPRLEVTRSPERDGAAYFGPFRNQGVLESAAGALADALQLRDCAVPGAQITRQRPCYRLELGTCSGPCLGNVSPAEYRRAVDSACSVFEGREQTALQILTARMERAAERLQFEIAARFRDVIRHIQSLGGRQQALLSATRSLSLVAACPSRRTDSLCLFVLRSGHLVLQEEVARQDLRDGRARRALAERLVALQPPARDAEAVRIDPALLDEVQIVTAWMKQRTREGSYWEFPTGTGKRELRAQLDAWLAMQVDEAVALAA
jgi:excinuclease UvrABC nuclease subunit